MEYTEFTGKTVDDAITAATLGLGVTSDQMEYEIIERGTTGLFGFGSKPAVIKARKKDTIEDFINEFLGKIFKAMELEAQIVITPAEEENVFNIEIKGEDMGVLIGKRGQTLDSLQLLTNLAVHKHFDEFYKVKIDTENYRKRRKDTLENLAKNIAVKVKKTRRPVSLEPMNPFERRVIHSALQNDKYVTTHSEGEDPFRYVIVSLKKREK